MKKDLNGVYLLGVDAKDLFLSNLSNPLQGYRTKKPEGGLRLQKFLHKLDSSLELIKLRETCFKIHRRNDFSFWQDGKEYTTKVIHVTFHYSCKEFNRCPGGCYLKYGYTPEDVALQDFVCVKNGQLLAIQTGIPVKNPIDPVFLGKWFVYQDGMYQMASCGKTLQTVSDLRRELYQNGFYCNGIHYVRYKRSSGSSRVGKCLFIEESLYSRMHKWELCGLKIKPCEQLDLAAVESYMSLTLSSIIGTVHIDPSSILVIPDYESAFNDEVIRVEWENGKITAHPGNAKITNNIWDGQSLIDGSILGPYKKFGFLLLRNRFFKSACFQFTAATNAAKGTNQMTAALNKQRKALESQKQALQEQREELQKQRDALQKAQQQMQDDQSAINSLLDLTMEMLRKKYEAEQEYEQETIDKLEEKYDAIKKTYKAENEAIQESINLKKEALEQQRDEREYQQELAEHKADILELETQLNTLRLDNSASAQKHALELEEELAEAKQDLNDFLYKHETQAQLDALEKQSEETDNYYQELAEKADLELEREKEIHNAKLEQLAEYLEGDVNLRNEAIALINARTDAFYQSLLDYNRKYGSGVDAEIKQKWDECYDALGRYNNSQINTLSTLNKLVESAGAFKIKISGLDGQISGLDSQISSVDKQISNVQSRLSDLNSQIGKVSNNLGKLQSSTRSELEVRRANKQKDLEILQDRWINELWILTNSEKEDMLNEINRTKQDINYLDSLIKQYSYHTGGIVGDQNFEAVGAHNVTSAMQGLIASLDSDEVVAKLQVGEAVLTQRQQQNLFRLLASHSGAGLALASPASGSSVVMGDIIVQGSADKSTVQAIRRVQEETVDMVFQKMNQLRRKAGIVNIR